MGDLILKRYNTADLPVTPEGGQMLFDNQRVKLFVGEEEIALSTRANTFVQGQNFAEGIAVTSSSGYAIDATGNVLIYGGSSPGRIKFDAASGFGSATIENSAVSSPYYPAFYFLSRGNALVELHDSQCVIYKKLHVINDSSESYNPPFIVDNGVVTCKTVNATTDLQLNGTSISSIYQATLVSGNNIKTINGNSLLGSGNIVITGSSGSVGITDGDKGDITVSGSGSIWTIDNNVITDSKISGSISQSKITSLVSDLSSKAPIASPTFTGTLTAPTLNGTSDIQLNGTSINTTGTLTNVAYKGQNNSFTVGQSMASPLTMTSKTNLIVSNAADGADDTLIGIGGGGSISNTRGAGIIFYGNEHASTGGFILTSGNVTGSFVSIRMKGNERIGITDADPTLVNITGNIKASGTITGAASISSVGASSSVGLTNSSVAPQVSISDINTGYNWYLQHRMDTRNQFRIQYYNGASYRYPFTIELDAPNNSITANATGVGIRTAYSSITDALTVTGNIKASGTVTAPTFNATTDLQLNSTSINTAGTLTNVAYYNKVNPFTQPISISPPNATANPLTLNRGDMTNFDIVIQKGGLDRWRIRMNNAPETGSNAGSDFAIMRRNDDGTLISPFPLFIYRSNGFVGINNNTPTEALDVTGNIKASGTVTAPTLNGTSAFQLNGTDINTTGTLTNVAYKGQDNNFTATQTIAGNIVLTNAADRVMLINTSDGSDNRYLGLSAGSALSSARSAYIRLDGNEVASSGGRLMLFAGNVATTGRIQFHVAGSATGQMNLGANGYLFIGSGTTEATEKLEVGSGNAKIGGTVTATQFKLSALNTAPASASAIGTLGEIRIVDGYIYVCVATNTWKRAAIATW